MAYEVEGWRGGLEGSRAVIARRAVEIESKTWMDRLDDDMRLDLARCSATVKGSDLSATGRLP